MTEQRTRAVRACEASDCLGTCTYAKACRMQWERAYGEWLEGYAGWFDDLAIALKCSEDCDSYEDTHAVPASMSGVMRP